MSRPQTYEQSLLNTAQNVLAAFSSFEERLLVIEACASMIGHFDIHQYWSAFQITPHRIDEVKEASVALFEIISTVGIPASMVLSSLSREIIPVSEQKQQGAFYTDFRLAEFAANDCEEYLNEDSNVADLAAGSGILLAGIAEKYIHKYPNQYESWIAKHVFAFDLSENALRGARISLAVHTSSIEALVKMNNNWVVCDSLLSEAIPNSYFDIVIGNPPWGKIKLSRHSFLNRTGSNHIYGSDYGEFDEAKFSLDKQSSLEYSKSLKAKYSLLGNSEPDMYMAFLQKAIGAIKSHGHLAFIVPAGLIRSQGTEQLRRHLLKNSAKLEYYLLDNKARFFEIDSRFKFLLVSQEKNGDAEDPTKEILFSICNTKGMDILSEEVVVFNSDELELIRPDLTIPECHNTAEKDLFFKIYKNGQSWQLEWETNISREVDMTNDKSDFHLIQGQDDIPVIEGRMVQQFRFGAKAYVSGSGRSAIWMPHVGTIKPQYYIEKGRLSDSVQERIDSFRVGYCDIAGQTNERAMMSAIIPANVVCGNKVPTIKFNGLRGEEYAYLWLGITNSFVFDWLVRRVISTTINYFLLFGLPMPIIDLESSIAQNIISKAKELSCMGAEYYKGDRMQTLRADIDILVAKAYNLSFSELEFLMGDFPLLDRAQPPIGKEKKSFITRDTLLSVAEKEYSIGSSKYMDRYIKGKKLGAKAYIPTEMTTLSK